jgi:hypothetical protein
MSKERRLEFCARKLPVKMAASNIALLDFSCKCFVSWLDFLITKYFMLNAIPLSLGTMNHWMWPVSLVGILSTAVVCGTDMFFLTVGRPALRLASSSAGTEVMGFLHMFGDARMPIWGVSAILSNFLLAVLSRSEQRWFYFASLLMLILFVISYLRLSKPINQIQTEAAKNGQSLDNGRELQASWDRSLIIRVPLLVVSLLAQCLVLLVASA